jgi:glycosyltransferase involved in cell wall biosynthesis
MIVRNFSPAGGLELYTHKLVEGLLARDVHVTVLCTQSSSPLEHPNLQVCKFRRSTAKLKAQRLVEEFYSVNEAFIELATGGMQFDIVHSQHQPMQNANVVTFHNHTVQYLSKVGLPWEQMAAKIKSSFVPAYRLRNYFDRMLFESAKCNIFTAGVTKDDFVSVYSTRAPQMVAYPGADLEKSVKNSPAANNHHNNSFLFVGRGYRKKGLDILLDACAQLKRHSIPFKLLIAGLPHKLLYDTRLRMLGISEDVEFLGFQSDMDAVYRQCSYFVMPSRVEPFGMAAVQAMQYGIVPIVSKESGVSEVLSHGRNALILQNHLSAKELASLMMSLLQDKELSVRLAKQAIITARNLTWDKTLQSTLNAYDATLNDKAAILSQ